jgi:hypothetical protein
MLNVAKEKIAVKFFYLILAKIMNYFSINSKLFLNKK